MGQFSGRWAQLCQGRSVEHLISLRWPLATACIYTRQILGKQMGASSSALPCPRHVMACSSLSLYATTFQQQAKYTAHDLIEEKFAFDFHISEPFRSKDIVCLCSAVHRIATYLDTHAAVHCFLQMIITYTECCQQVFIDIMRTSIESI